MVSPDSATSCCFTRITFPSVPCSISLVTLRTCCALGNRNIAMNKTKPVFSWNFLYRISRKMLSVGIVQIFSNTALISNWSSWGSRPGKPIQSNRTSPSLAGPFPGKLAVVEFNLSTACDGSYIQLGGSRHRLSQMTLSCRSHHHVRSCARPFFCGTCGCPTTVLWGRFYYFHFALQKTKAQGG